MIRKSDVQWWVLEAQRHPESAPGIIEELAQRLIELDTASEHLRDQVIRLQQRDGATAADSDAVAQLRSQIAALQIRLERAGTAEPVLILLSDRLQAAAVPLSNLDDLARTGRPPAVAGRTIRVSFLVVAQPHDSIFALTSQGRALRMLPTDAASPTDEGFSFSAEHPGLTPDERVTTVLATPASPRFWTVVTRRGHTRQFIHTEFNRHIAQGAQLIESPHRRDRPTALVDSDSGDLFVLTRWGAVARFPQQTIGLQGSQAFDLDDDDAVVSALSLTAETDLLAVTASGMAIRRNTTQFPARPEPGGDPRSLVQAFDVLGAFDASAGRVAFVTFSGRIAVASTGAVVPQHRTGKGVSICDLMRDPAVAAVALPPA